MRVTALLVILLLLPASALAVDLTCTVPPGDATTKGSELCEALRSALKVRAADWDNDTCATEFLRRSLRVYEVDLTRAAAQAAVEDDVVDARTTFDGNYPPVYTPATCGDGVVDDTDPNLGEECDPPNGTTCDGECAIIP